MADTAFELHVPNAIEMSWTVPFDIPSDRTEAKIGCSADIAADLGAGFYNQTEYWQTDPISIYQ